MQVIVVGAVDAKLEGLLKQPARTVVCLSEPQAARRKPAPSDIFVIDARNRDHVPSFLAAFVKEAADCGIIVVCSRLDPAFMLGAMRAGVRECLAEPLSGADLEAAISRVAAERSAHGVTFAFVGAKGGVGTTTVAVNVAIELSRVAPRQTLLIDLHLSNGDAGLFLGEEPRFSVADALDNVHRLDEAFLRSLVVRTKSPLDLLGSPNVANGAAVDSERIRSLVEFAQRCYRYTVLDVPRSEPASLEALDSAERVIVIANQELATVRNASRMVATLRSRYGGDRVAVAVARYDPTARIRRDDVEHAVGMKVAYVLPSDYRRAVEALNSGKPLSLGNHNGLAGSFRMLAHDLAGLPASEDQPAGTGGILGLLTGRRN